MTHSGGRSPQEAEWPRRWWDWLLAADPGLADVQTGWRALVTMPVAIAVGYAMSHVLSIGVVQGTVAAGLVGVLSAFVIAENNAPRLSRSLLWLPIPYGLLLPLASWLGPHRAVEQGVMALALALAFVFTHFGPLGVPTILAALAAFVTAAFADVRLPDCAQFSIVIAVTMVSILAARLLLCRPAHRRSLLHTRRVFLIETRRVADAAASALEPDADRSAALNRMRRALRRLHASALTIDGYLAYPDAEADRHAAESLHQRLFDVELALRDLGRVIERWVQQPANATLREAAVIALTTVNAREAKDTSPSITRAQLPFEPAVELEGARPAGAGPAARRAAAAHERQGWRRAIDLSRVPLQVGVAAVITSPIADVISPQHFYWALIGVVFNFIGPTTIHDRLRRFAHRMAGTAVGAAVGIALLVLIGRGHVYPTLAICVILLPVGVWSASRAYAYWVVCLTAALVQVYGLIYPSASINGLMGQRLVENGLGMGVAAACAALIFPVTTREIAREAQRGYLSALEQLVTQTSARWTEPQSPVRLRGAARAVDAALIQVQSVLRPLIPTPTESRERSGENRLTLLSRATEHARRLAAAANADIDLSPRFQAELARITRTLIDSLHALDQNMAMNKAGGTWVRTSPAIRELQSRLHASSRSPTDRLHTALDELAELDDVLVSLANDHGMTIT